MTEDFWTARSELKHIRDFARSRRTNPFSTLAVVLVRACCMIRPGVVLPPIIGGAVAPNLFAALVGESGAGKGASEAAGRDAIRWIIEDDVPEFSPGSGEGIARTLMGDPTALFVAPEIDTLGALFIRKGQTLEPELRKLFMGERLGFANAGKDTRTNVEALMYRAGLIIGVQPLRGGVLISSRDGGTPQRFLWAPVRDPDMPIERPTAMEPLGVVPSHFDGYGIREIRVCRAARVEIEQRYVDYHRGALDADLLDGHALLTQLKVAAGLMALAGRSSIEADDWEIAEQIMAVSRVTRASVVRAADEQRRRQNTARAADTLEREEFIGDSKVRRAKRALMRKLDKLTDDEVIPHHELRRVLKAILRDEFDPAISELIEEGYAIRVKLERGYGYMKGHVSFLGHGTSPAETCRVPSVSRVPTPSVSTCENGEIPETNYAEVQRAIDQARAWASKQERTGE